MNLFHNAKHWQLFILTFLITVVAITYSMGAFMSQFIPFIKSNTDGDAIRSFMVSMANQFSWVPLILIVVMIIAYAWHWSVAVKLQSKIPDHLKIDTSRYKMVLVFYILTNIVFFTGCIMVYE